ncbi:MAG: hypothetical protein RLZZ338_577 [Cyanobacteriota bacterium]
MSAVILVHGVGLWGAEMLPLGCRLRKSGYQTRQFYYSTRRVSLEQNATYLQKFLEAEEADIIHFVGHSLGGLLIYKLFQDYPQQRRGKIVTLGTPHNGSSLAYRLSRQYGGKFLLGRSVMTGLFDTISPPPNRDVGIIAGSLDIGTGWLLRVPQPNDSLISVEETRADGVNQHLVLPVSHTGLLVAPTVAKQICTFLKTGHFLK